MFHAFIYVAPVSVFGFRSRELQVMENIGAQQLCVVMLSGGPLLEVVVLSLTFTDNTATGQYFYCYNLVLFFELAIHINIFEICSHFVSIKSTHLCMSTLMR